MAEPPGVETTLSRGRELVAAGSDAEALKALDEVFRSAQKQRDVERLREVAGLASVVARRCSGSLAGKAERLGYAASQNVRGLERRLDWRERQHSRTRNCGCGRRDLRWCDWDDRDDRGDRDDWRGRRVGRGVPVRQRRTRRWWPRKSGCCAAT